MYVRASGWKNRPSRPCRKKKWQEHHHDDHRGEDHRRPDLIARIEDDLDEGTTARFLGGPILLQPAKDVLHVDDRVVNEYADGHRQSAKGHDIQP